MKNLLKVGLTRRKVSYRPVKINEKTSIVKIGLARRQVVVNTQRKAEVGERRGNLEIVFYTWGHANLLECKLRAVIYLFLGLAVSELA